MDPYEKENTYFIVAVGFAFLSMLFVSYAEQTEFANQSFDDLMAKRAVTVADGFASVPTYQTVMEEGREARIWAR